MTGAVAAVAAALNEGASLSDCAKALASYQGVARRFQSLGVLPGLFEGVAHHFGTEEGLGQGLASPKRLHR